MNLLRQLSKVVASQTDRHTDYIPRRFVGGQKLLLVYIMYVTFTILMLTFPDDSLFSLRVSKKFPPLNSL